MTYAQCRNVLGTSARSIFGLLEVFQATTSRWVTGVTRALSGFGLGNNKVLRHWIDGEIGLGNSEAVTQEAGVRGFLDANKRSQLRLENRRAIITEIDNVASRVVTEKIAMASRLPSPRILDVMGDGSRRHF